MLAVAVSAASKSAALVLRGLVVMLAFPFSLVGSSQSRQPIPGW